MSSHAAAVFAENCNYGRILCIYLGVCENGQGGTFYDTAMIICKGV